MDFGQEGYIDEFLARYPEHEDLVGIGKIIVGIKPDYAQFRQGMGQVIRQAYDEVIDMPRTKRWSLDDLASTEKTYVGTKVEILVQHWLGLERGENLDLSIDGHDVDVKNTVRSNWMIPMEAVGHICLLIKGDERSSRYSVGLVRAKEQYLTAGGNRDRKRTISAAHFDKILWLADDAGLPVNFFLNMSEEKRTTILMASSGAARVRELFRQIQLTVIPRSAIEGVANQRDALKRVRKNGGARDKLLVEGILVLSRKYDTELISDLELPALGSEEFISIPREYITQRLGEDRTDELFHAG